MVDDRQAPSPVGNFDDITADAMALVKPGTTPVTDVGGY